MTMKERLAVHHSIEQENQRKLILFLRYEEAFKHLGFYPPDERELLMFECNGYDDYIYSYK